MPPPTESAVLPAGMTPALALPASTAPPARHLRAVPEVPLDFDAAVRALTPRLQRYATRRLGDAHEAADLVQEALLRAYQHRAKLRTEDDVAAWTTCVTGRLVIDRIRVRARSTSVAEVPEGGRSARDTADVVVARDQARLALDALDAMPPRQAAVLWAREVEGLGYDGIGERFGMTEPAVRSLLTRARKGLRKEYATRGGTLPSAGLALLAPWASGTGWLERLRAGFERAPGLASLGVVGAGLVTGALVLPAAPPTPATTTVPVVTRLAAPEPAPLQARPTPPTAMDLPRPDAVSLRVAVEPVTPPAPVATTPATPLERTGLDGTCVAAAGAGAGGADCADAPAARDLTVEVPLDTSPAGVEAPTLSTERVPCRALPDVPLTRCTTPGDPQ